MLLARALLALACAAPLLAARAASPTYPDSNQCTSNIKGVTTNKMLTLPVGMIPPQVRRVRIDIPDNCYYQNMQLVGERVTVCDADESPKIEFPPGPAFTPVIITRLGQLLTPSYVYIYQYCA